MTEAANQSSQRQPCRSLARYRLMTAAELLEKAKEARDLVARARRLARAVRGADRARLEQYAEELEQDAIYFEAEASRSSKC